MIKKGRSLQKGNFNFKNKLINLITRFKVTGLFYKELMLLVRRKKAPLLVVLLPFVLSIVYLSTTTALTNPEITLTVGVCNYDSNPQVQEMINELSWNFYVKNLDIENCDINLRDEIKKGTYIIGLSIPDDFSDRLINSKQGILTFYVDESQPSLISVVSLVLNNGLKGYSTKVVKANEDELHALANEARDKLNELSFMLNLTINVLTDNKEVVGLIYPLLNSYLSDLDRKVKGYDSNLAFAEELNVQFITEPIIFNRGSVYNISTPVSFNFAVIFAIVSLFTLLLLCSTGYIFDKRNDYLMRIRATKTYIPVYLIIKVIFYALISSLQFVMILLIMIFTQKAVFNFNLESFIVSYLLVITLNSLIGILIGIVSKSENVAILISLIMSLPFIFLSGGTVPIEFLPGYLQFIANVFPLKLQVQLLKLSTVLGYSLIDLAPLINTAVTYIVIAFTSVYFLLRHER